MQIFILELFKISVSRVIGFMFMDYKFYIYITNIFLCVHFEFKIEDIF